MDQYTIPGTIIVMLITIGALGKAKVWVFGWYFEEMCSELKKQLKEKNDTIERLLNVLEENTETERLIAAHVKSIKPTDNVSWDGGRTRGSRHSRTREPTNG